MTPVSCTQRLFQPHQGPAPRGVSPHGHPRAATPPTPALPPGLPQRPHLLCFISQLHLPSSTNRRAVCPARAEGEILNRKEGGRVGRTQLPFGLPPTSYHSPSGRLTFQRPQATSPGGMCGAQSCLTLQPHPMDCSPPGSSLHGILQSRISEWVATSYSKGSY